MSRPRIYVEELDTTYLDRIRAGLEWVNIGSKVKKDDLVFVKPNLTYPNFRRGVMTNPECVEALVIALKDFTNRIVVGEADSGGYNRFGIDEVFGKTGIFDLAKRYGIRVVNLSHLPYRPVSFIYRGRLRSVPLPTLLLDETSGVVSVPVPKVHMNTGVSISIKNQWGCIPEPQMRLRLHPLFPKVIYEVNKHIRTFLSVVDGKYGLNRSGPMLGDAIKLNWLMVSDDIYAADAVCCRLLQIDPHKISYIRYLDQVERVVPDLTDINFSQDWQRFVSSTAFCLRRSYGDYLSLAAFRSSTISYLAYFSPMAEFLHSVMYLFRKPMYNYADPSSTEPGEGNASAASTKATVHPHSPE